MRDNEMQRRRFLAVLGAVGASAALLPTTQAGASALASASGRQAMLMVLIASYTSSPSESGVDVAHRVPGGALEPGETVEGVPNASFLAWSPNHQYVYATNEQDDGKITALDLTGEMPKVLNQQSSRGGAPTHLTVHPSGKYLLTANYGDGTVVVHRRKDDGSIGESTDLVQHDGTEPHAHQVVVDPQGKWVTAVDLGADSVYVYALDMDTGKLTKNSQLKLPTGNGPRHLVFHPDGEHAYLLSEVKSELRVLSWDWKAGKYAVKQVIGTREDGSTGSNFPSEIAVSSDGKFVYASNRGDDNIATFTVDGGPDKLKFVGTTPTGGQWPRHFTLDPEEKSLYIANQNSGTITRLKRNKDTGALTPTPDKFEYPSVAMLTFHA